MTVQPSAGAAAELLARVRAAARQEQFLEIVSAAEARTRFARHLDVAPLGAEPVALADALGRVLARTVAAPIDVPPFDRSGVDGFAVQAADTNGASDGAPRRLRLNPEVISCGHVPACTVEPGTATAIATGGAVPRGADAVVMIEHTELADAIGAAPDEAAILVRRAVYPGAFVAHAGSDMARGEVLLRRGALIGSREIGMLAACGLADVPVVRRPRVAVLSTGDELVPPGAPLPPAAVYDSNAAILAAAVAEAGGEAVAFGAIPDDALRLVDAMRRAIAECDIVVLSGGTSKGAGDVSARVVADLGPPGVIVHGVALKPGKPLCLAVVSGKPVVILPGFPTSAVFTFHAFVAPLIRARAGLPVDRVEPVAATVPVRIPSEMGREEFVMVALVAGDTGPVAVPTGKGSGSVTAFSQADGFIVVDALSAGLEAGAAVAVTPIGRTARPPDLVVTGSHDVALEIVLDRLAEQGFSVRTLAVGSTGGVLAAQRGECDLAPVHLVDEATSRYNVHLLRPGLSLLRGWTRMQGVVFRHGDPRFADGGARAGVARALVDPAARMVSRNAGSGTRVLIDRLLAGARPPGVAHQPKSHNAVAAAVAQGRADWGIAIETVARQYGLGFLPIAPEHYDFLQVDTRAARPAVQAFRTALHDASVRARIVELGMTPADEEER